MPTPIVIDPRELDHSKLPLVVGIVGSREFEKRGVRQHVYADMLRFINKLASGTTIVSGGAIGVDTYAEEIADNFHMTKEIFRPNESLPVPKRFFVRNQQIVNYLKDHGGTLVSFVMHNHHRGTSRTIQLARKKDVPRLTFAYHEDGTFDKLVCDITLVKDFVRE